MVSATKNILIVAFILNILWQSSESLNLEYRNRTLARVRRQSQGHACKDGDPFKFQCETTAQCIDEDDQCNGKTDCQDGSDEKESLCRNIPCPRYLFKCNYGACISTTKRCDGKKDCYDHSDEIGCVTTTTKMNTNCRSDQFECNNGQCIEIDGKCNGVAECTDKSDETEELCLNIFCPGYTYKCKYGACVDGDSKCNKVMDCIDNSDESEEICGPKEPVVTTGGPPIIEPRPSGDVTTCLTPEQPQNGKWVYLSNPGQKGGPNVQVESSTIIIFTCNKNYKLSDTNNPEYFVVCMKTGEWSPTKMPTCQNPMDCINNWDERCGPGKTCRTPEHPQNGQWVYSYNSSQKGEPNVRVESRTVIIFSCNNNYKLSVTNDPEYFMRCKETGKWSLTKIPTCQLLCPVHYSNTIMTVKCSINGFGVPCDKATDETELTYKCSPYYEIPLENPGRSICFRGSWDHSPQCIPVCGQKRVDVEPLMVGGVEVERGHYPWVVALYNQTTSTGSFTNICSGSLITTRIVLTAAHCVAKKEGGEAYPPQLYRIAAGKYYNKYKDPRDDDTAQYSEIEEIQPSKEYKGSYQNFRGDIALLKLKTELKLSKVVQPVCFHNLPQLEPDTIGTVTGWGYTEAGGEPSDVLNELDLPFHDDDTCQQKMDADFGRQFFTTDKFCAGFSRKSKSVCKGDSGGGLVFRNAKFRDRFFIHGIVSLGHSITRVTDVLCNIQSSALFTKVNTYISWIQMTVHKWSKS